MKRDALLKKALETVTKERTGHYGEPQDVFDTIAAFWTIRIQSIMHRFPDGKIVLDKTDVAMMMALLKVARQAVSPEYLDNYVDLAGYGACGAETSGAECPQTPN